MGLSDRSESKLCGGGGGKSNGTKRKKERLKLYLHRTFKVTLLLFRCDSTLCVKDMKWKWGSKSQHLLIILVPHLLCVCVNWRGRGDWGLDDIWYVGAIEKQAKIFYLQHRKNRDVDRKFGRNLYQESFSASGKEWNTAPKERPVIRKAGKTAKEKVCCRSHEVHVICQVPRPIFALQHRSPM